jgi:putative heme-binding domain-containing protein
VVEESDFITSDDPWFRPVDLQVGPDGALYIADFYNRIVGHYEVPLDHPGRDRYRGRIWRVVYQGEGSGNTASSSEDGGRGQGAATLTDLIAAFGHPNLNHRMRALDACVDRFGTAATGPLTHALRHSEHSTVRIQAMWALHRLNQLDGDDLMSAARDKAAVVRTHALRVLAETGNWSQTLEQVAIQALSDGDGRARRAAVGAMQQKPRATYIEPLISLLGQTADDDAHLSHSIKLALLECIRIEGALAKWSQSAPTREAHKAMADVALALTSPEAGAYLLAQLQVHDQTDAAHARKYLAHVAKFLPRKVEYEQIAALVEKLAADDLDLQLDLLAAVRDGIRQRGLDPLVIRPWCARLAERLLASIDNGGLYWKTDSVDGEHSPHWQPETRPCEDGRSATFLSSFPLEEEYIGRACSQTFEIPPMLSLYVCGHLGPPDRKAIESSFVRLRLAGTDRIIASAHPPRSDTAARIEWDLSQHSGQLGYLEIVDGIDSHAFAWIAVGRLEPKVVSVPQIPIEEIERRLVSAAGLAREYELRQLRGPLADVVAATDAPPEARQAAADAMLALEPSPLLASAADLLDEPAVSTEIREEVAAAIVQQSSVDAAGLIRRVFEQSPGRVQSSLAERLAATPAGAAALVSLAEAGAASARLLLETPVQERLSSQTGANLNERIARLTADLPDFREELAEVVREHQAAFRTADCRVDVGREVFLKHCASCHAFDGVGSLVGPQLDGVSHRGHERVIEDILDPNRNVDPKFCTSLLVCADGRVISGLMREERGELVVLADREGKEITVEKNSIESKKQSKSSLMPDNYVAMLKPSELYALVAFLQTDRPDNSQITWRAIEVDRKFRSEGVAIADVDRDGDQDVLVGDYWYSAPDWAPHAIRPPGEFGDGASGYSESFLCFAEDLNRDEWPDLIVIGFPGKPCHWYENPQGRDRHWIPHVIWHSACNETPLYVDLFGNGRRVLVMGWQLAGQENAGQMAWFAPGDDPAAPWVKHAISRQGSPDDQVPGTHRYAHGLGAGDLNGDGRSDVICTAGWWEQPAELDDTPWPFHPAELGEACANMIVDDFTGDGRADVITSSAHNYGIWLHMQQGSGGELKFTTKELFPKLISQTHALINADVDGDGLQDMITGKRWWAHGPRGDVGSDEPAEVVWFQARRAVDGSVEFTPRRIHSDSGIGTQFVVDNFNGDRLPDVVTSNKKGVFVFEQQRGEPGK